MTSNEKKIITITSFGHFMSHFNMLFFPALVIPMASYHDTNVADIVSRSFWMYCLFGITALPWGFLADRLGARLLMIIFHIGAGFCCLGAGLWINHPDTMAIYLAGLGVFSGIYHPTGLGWISHSVSRISIGMAINGMCGNLGMAVAPILAGFINWMYGLKAVFLFVSGINCLGILLLLCLSVQSHINETEPSKYSKNKLLKTFIILLVTMMFGGMAYRGSTVILPAYFELKNQGVFQFFSLFFHDLSPNVVAAVSVSLVFLAGMAGQYAGGRFAEHFDLRYCYIAFHLVCIPMAILMAYIVNFPLIVITMVYFFFLLGMQPIENTLVAKLSPSQFMHSAYGAKFVVTFGIAALSVKMVAGIEKHMGMSPVFLVLSGVSILIILCIVALIMNTDPIRMNESRL